ncbi:hypothetical protein ACFQ3S_11565 [Mucilaginibacter terrae]|uniref:hypothetical protein n=1 Tax=Mucilaginibacter terrae TaxID=1955052 RepID=UPI00362971B7
MMREQDVYVIIANNESVTFLKFGKYNWDEIDSIDTHTQISPWGSTRHEEKYLLLNLINGESFSIEVTNCDYQLYEIADKLKRIGKLV